MIAYRFVFFFSPQVCPSRYLCIHEARFLLIIKFPSWWRKISNFTRLSYDCIRRTDSYNNIP